MSVHKLALAHIGLPSTTQGLALSFGSTGQVSQPEQSPRARVGGGLRLGLASVMYGNLLTTLLLGYEPWSEPPCMTSLVAL